jgi:6-phosphogluconolactonase (cycloisomerase 2 family)
MADSFVGNSRASEIEVDRSGKCLYYSNRGEDTIAVFSIDPAHGRLSLIQSQPSLGKTPRFFALSPQGRWLYALNEDSDTIVVFEVDPLTGKLRATDLAYACGSPVCLVFG